MSTAGGPRIRLPRGPGGNAASLLPTGQSFDRVSTVVLGTERGDVTPLNRALNPSVHSLSQQLSDLRREIRRLKRLIHHP